MTASSTLFNITITNARDEIVTLRYLDSVGRLKARYRGSNVLPVYLVAVFAKDYPQYKVSIQAISEVPAFSEADFSKIFASDVDADSKDSKLVPLSAERLANLLKQVITSEDLIQVLSAGNHIIPENKL